MGQAHQILVVDRDRMHSETLESAIRSENLRVLACSEQGIAIEIMKATSVDLVVIIAESALQWKKDIGQFCDMICRFGRQPLVLCVLRWHSTGPEDRLYGDALNVVVLHEE